MKELLVLLRRRKTHLLAGNVGTDPYIALEGLRRGRSLEMKEPPPLFRGGRRTSWRFRHGIAVSNPWFRHGS